MSQKEWYLAKELTGLIGLPKTLSSISRKASNEDWKKRQTTGVKGITYEYHISSLPDATRKQLGAKISPPSDPTNKRVILSALLDEASDELIDGIYQQAVHKGIDSLCIPQQDQSILGLLSDLNEQERKEIFAFVRKAKYMLLAGLTVDPAMKVDVDDDRKAG